MRFARAMITFMLGYNFSVSDALMKNNTGPTWTEIRVSDEMNRRLWVNEACSARKATVRLSQLR